MDYKRWSSKQVTQERKQWATWNVSQHCPLFQNDACITCVLALSDLHGVDVIGWIIDLFQDFVRLWNFPENSIFLFSRDHETMRHFRQKDDELYNWLKSTLDVLHKRLFQQPECIIAHIKSLDYVDSFEFFKETAKEFQFVLQSMIDQQMQDTFLVPVSFDLVIIPHDVRGDKQPLVIGNLSKELHAWKKQHEGFDFICKADCGELTRSVWRQTLKLAREMFGKKVKQNGSSLRKWKRYRRYIVACDRRGSGNDLYVFPHRHKTAGLKLPCMRWIVQQSLRREFLLPNALQDEHHPVIQMYDHCSSLFAVTHDLTETGIASTLVLNGAQIKCCVHSDINTLCRPLFAPPVAPVEPSRYSDDSYQSRVLSPSSVPRCLPPDAYSRRSLGNTSGVSASSAVDVTESDGDDEKYSEGKPGCEQAEETVKTLDDLCQHIVKELGTRWPQLASGAGGTLKDSWDDGDLTDEMGECILEDLEDPGNSELCVEHNDEFNRALYGVIEQYFKTIS